MATHRKSQHTTVHGKPRKPPKPHTHHVGSTKHGRVGIHGDHISHGDVWKHKGQHA